MNDSNSECDRKAAALDYLARGWSPLALCPPEHAGCTAAHVERCSCPGKRPWIKWKKYQDQHATPAEVEHWFRKLPNSNVGIALGPVSGLIRIDVDGAKGAELLQQKSGGELPSTLEFTSGGSGLGLLYSISEGCTLKTTSDKGDGEHQELRFQAKGAQTVLPPSIHPDGRVYQWKLGHSPDDMAAAPAPEWLIRELSPPPPSPSKQVDSDEVRTVNEAAEPHHHRSDDIALAREALEALRPLRASNHDVWIDVGMALHSTSDSLLGDWINFSRLCPEKFREGECAEKWSRFSRNGKVTLGTLFHIAKQDGWMPPWERNGCAKSGTSKPAREFIPWKPFPVDALPGTIAHFVRMVAAAMGCDLAFVAVPLLPTLASCVGNTRRIRLKKSWSEPSVIWASTIAPPSSLKSPAWQAAVDPLHQIQQERMDEFDSALLSFEAEKARHDVAMTVWKQAAKKGGDTPPPEAAQQPICTRHITTDCTVEALVSLESEQPRGLLYAVDELAGWLNGLNQYKGGKGGDLQAYLSMHRAGPVTTDRKTGKRVFRVARAALSISGTIQPAIYKRLASTEFRESGLLARLLVAMPPVGRKQWTEADVDDETLLSLRKIIEGLLNLQFDETIEKPEPVYIGMTREAKAEWITFYNEFAGEQAEADEYQAGHFGKIEAYCPRFALVIQMIRAVEGVASDNEIDVVSMKSAILLARWFAHESRRVLAMLTETKEESDRRSLVDLIMRHGGRITARGLMQASREFRQSAETAEKALRSLVTAGLGRYETIDTGGRQRTEFVLNEVGPGNGSLENPEKNTLLLPLPRIEEKNSTREEGVADATEDGEDVIEWTA